MKLLNFLDNIADKIWDYITDKLWNDDPSINHHVGLLFGLIHLQIVTNIKMKMVIE